MKNTSFLHKCLSTLSMRIVFRLSLHPPVWMSEPNDTRGSLDLPQHLCTIVVPPALHCPPQLTPYNLNLTKTQNDNHVPQLLPIGTNVRRSQKMCVLWISFYDTFPQARAKASLDLHYCKRFLCHFCLNSCKWCSIMLVSQRTEANTEEVIYAQITKSIIEHYWDFIIFM